MSCFGRTWDDATHLSFARACARTRAHARTRALVYVCARACACVCVCVCKFVWVCELVFVYGIVLRRAAIKDRTHVVHRHNVSGGTETTWLIGELSQYAQPPEFLMA